jgi:hypothetical protein
LAVVGNDLVLLRSNESDDTLVDAVDWDKLEEAHKIYEEKVAQDGAILLITNADAPLAETVPRVRNWTIFEKPPLKGKGDAGIQAQVSLAGEALAISLVAEDDVAKPVPAGNAPDATFLKSDHFEIWYCAAAAAAGCKPKEARQLGVGRAADGAWQARWLHPKGNKEKLPGLEPNAGGAGVRVLLPLAEIHHEGSADVALEGGLTAVYSDADTDGKGQEAVVATSKLRWGDGGSFGRFVRHAEGGRFPVWAGSAGLERTDKFLADLPPLRL